ncbi:MAG: hypothetical protein AUK44_05895 [Porphyromonadaceae bacterium CG2_30_38_12]|nr:MAG: hypothetical protein AUK44_05895 [Porphyromonadaceae bacterium CG2_30_38_12]
MRYLKEIPSKSQLLYTAIAMVAIYLASKSLLVQLNIYSILLNNYAQLITLTLDTLFGSFSYHAESGLITHKTVSFNPISSLAIKFYFIAFALLFTKPRKLKKTFLVLLSSFFLFYTLTILRYANDIYATEAYKPLFFTMIVAARYLILYAILKYKIALHPRAASLYTSIDIQIRESFIFSLSTLLMIVSGLPFLTGIFDWFLLDKWGALVIFLSHFILWMSNISIALLGYPQAFVTGSYLVLNNYWVYLGTNCLGVGLMVVFGVLVFSIKSNIVNRIVFTTLGIAMLLLMNALRIAIILKHIYNNQLPQHEIEDYHNMSNNIYYIFVFLIIVVYIKWFQFIRIRQTNSKT